MAALRGTLTGSRGTASRLGSKASGIGADLNTWNRRVRVQLNADGSATVAVESYSPGCGAMGATVEYILEPGDGAGELVKSHDSRERGQA